MRPAQKLPAHPSSPLLELLAAFAGRKVLVIGDLVADHYIFGQTDRISREAPVLIVRYESAEVKLGGAGNAANNLKALGAKVTALGVVGRDEMGTSVRELCRDSSIRLVSPKAPGIATETKTRILAGGINTRRQQMLRLDRGHEGSLPAAVQAEIAGLFKELAKSADAVLVSDYGAGVLGEAVIPAVLAVARDGLPVCVDSRYNLRAFAGAGVLKPNEPEFEALTGVRPDVPGAFERALKAAHRKLAAQAIVVTRGRNGMMVLENGRMETIPAHGSKEAVDVTGAGDTVGATMTVALASGASVVDAARLANVAGALKVQKAGTETVSRAELAQELESMRP